MKDKKKQKITEESRMGNDISRKDAMKKLGLTAFSAATMMILLNNPAKGQGESPPPDPEWP